MNGSGYYSKQHGSYNMDEGGDMTGYSDCDSSRITNLQVFLTLVDPGDFTGDTRQVSNQNSGTGRGPVYTSVYQSVPSFTPPSSCHTCTDNKITWHYHIHAQTNTGHVGDVCAAMSVLYGSSNFQLYTEQCP
jgi:hypothetical protein